MKYTESDLVRIAKRENNNKRNYLVVDPLQGKHIPVSPSRALELFSALADTFRNEYVGERLLLVGFAETATAIGAQAAVSLGVNYIQTTREIIPGVEYLFFSEEHSHATEQKLVKGDIDSAAEYTDRIVFVEDEVTTGKTILNIIDILDRLYEGRFGFSVASLLNGMDEENLKKYADRGINLHYLVKTDHSGYIERAEVFAGDGEYIVSSDNCDIETLKALKEKCNFSEIRVPGAINSRRLVSASEYSAGCERLWQAVKLSREKGASRADELSGEKGASRAGRILVVGTEECMYPALYVGKRLEDEGYFVRSHSTTRSPIAVSTEEAYPLYCRYELKSLYDIERRTFIYNIEKYDEVYIVTDADGNDNSGLFSLLNALGRYNDKITLIRWC